MTGEQYRQFLKEVDAWWPGSEWPPETEDVLWERLQVYPLDLAMRCVQELKHLTFRPKPGVMLGHMDDLRAAHPDVWILDRPQLPGACPEGGDHTWALLWGDDLRHCVLCHHEEPIPDDQLRDLRGETGD